MLVVRRRRHAPARPDRVGGRAWTIELSGMPLDMGCGWLHSAERNPLVALGRDTGFTIESGPTAWQSQWRDLGFAPQQQAAAAAAWMALEARLRADPPQSDRASDALEPGGEWNAYCQSLSGYLNGAPLERLSVADFLAYDSAATDSNWRVHEGYGSLIGAAVPDVALRLSTPVRRVALTGKGVRLSTDRGAVTAGAAIVTVSTAVLAGGKIAFDAAERERIALYRAYLHLIMWIEAVPRKNDGKRLAWLRGFAFEPLAKTLDRWEASRA